MRSERDYNAPREILAAGDDPDGQTNIFATPSSEPETVSAVQPPQTDPSAAVPALETPVADMTDAEFLLHLLGDGEWWMLADILQRSQLERGCGMTVHSRAADLRRNGYIVENTRSKNETDRTDSFYRLAGRTP